VHGVWYYEGSENQKVIALAHVDHDGDIEFGVSRTLHKTLSSEYVVLLADDGPE
jgi:hypothetical protein